MNKEEILHFAKLIGCDKVSFTRKSVLVNCPLARWTHKGGNDSNPSCSIFIEPDDRSSYNCFACHNSGTINDLLYRLNKFTKGQYESLNDWLVKVNTPDLNLRLDRALNNTAPDIIIKDNYRTFEESELDGFKNHVPQYILDRKINISSCKIWELGYDNNGADPRLIFPIRDMDKKLVGIVGRTILANRHPKYKNYWGFNKEKFLYGECHPIEDNKPFVVGEGMIGTIKIKQVMGCNSYGIMGSYPSEQQVNKLIGLCGTKPLITFFDGDSAGDSARRGISKMLEDKLVVFHIKPPRGTDPADIEEDLLVDLINKVGF